MKTKLFLVFAVLALLVPALAAAQNTISNSNDANINTPSQSITTPDHITVKNVPSVSGPSVQTTAPCIVGVSGSVSIVGFGASLGKGVEDIKCTEREEARVYSGLLLQAAGNEAAIAYLCMNPKTAPALGNKCPATKTPASTVSAKTTVVIGEEDPFVCARTGERCPKKK